MLADGDLAVELAARLGVTLTMPHELEEKVRALVRTPPGPPGDPPYVRATGAASGGALRVVLDAGIFTGGGTLAHDSAIAELRAQPRAGVNPATAQALGVTDGDRVDVSADRGAVLRDLVVRVDERVPDGAVALTAGLVAAPANVLGPAPAVRVTKALVTA